MDIFLGLSPEQQQDIHRSATYKTLESGVTLFEAGDVATALFAVSTGTVEIIGKTAEGEVEIDRIGPGQVFGEMGVLSAGKKRLATARTVTETVLFELPLDPEELLSSFDGSEMALVVMKNLICILAARLKDKGKQSESVKGEHLPLTGPVDNDEALETIRMALPKGLSRVFGSTKSARAGEVLFRAGEPSESFLFIHSGRLDVLSSGDGNADDRRLAEIVGPAVVGELGFFAGEPRAADLVTVDTVKFTRFSASDFEDLWYKDPTRCLEVLLAAAQLIVNLIVTP